MAVANFRQALNSLTIADFDHFDALASEFSTHRNTLKKQHTEIKRLLTAIRKLQPDFVWDNHTPDNLTHILDNLKNSKKLQEQQKKQQDKLQKQTEKKQSALKLKEQNAIDKYTAEISQLQKSSGIFIDIPSNPSSEQLKQILTTQKNYIAQMAKENTQRQNIILKIIQFQPDFSKKSMASLDDLKDILERARQQSNTQKTLQKKLDTKKNQILALQPTFDFASVDISSLDALQTLLNKIKTDISIQKKETKLLQSLQDKIKKLNSDFDCSKYDTSDKLQQAYEQEKLRLKNTNKQLQIEQKKNLPKQAKNKFYQNYLTWLKTEYDEDHIKTHGGPRKFASQKWATLSPEQKKDPSAQWNILATQKTSPHDDGFA